MKKLLITTIFLLISIPGFTNVEFSNLTPQEKKVTKETKTKVSGDLGCTYIINMDGVDYVLTVEGKKIRIRGGTNKIVTLEQLENILIGKISLNTDTLSADDGYEYTYYEEIGVNFYEETTAKFINIEHLFNHFYSDIQEQCLNP